MVSLYLIMEKPVARVVSFEGYHYVPTSWYYRCVFMDSHPVDFTSCGVFAEVWLCSIPLRGLRQYWDGCTEHLVY